MSALPVGDDRVAAEARIAAELLRLARPHRVQGQVMPPPPYVRRHVVEHAAAGNALDDRFFSADFLPYVDAPRLRALMTAAPDLGSPDAAAASLADVWRKVAHAWAWEDPAANADALEFWAEAYNVPVSVQTRADGVWRTRWVHWGAGEGEILGSDIGWVQAVAAAVLADGTPVAVAAYARHAAASATRTWSLTDGSPIGNPLTGPPIDMGPVAVGVLPDGAPIIVTSGYDTVRAWGLAAGTWIGQAQVGSVARLAATTLSDGTPIAVISGFDNVLHAWNLAAGTRIGPRVIVPRGAQPGPPEVAAAALPDGTVIAVTGSRDGTVQAWDLSAGSLIGGPLAAHPGAVAKWPNILRVAVAARSDGTLIAVAGGCDDTVQAWDLAAGAAIGNPLTGPPGAVSKVAVGMLRDGTPIAVTGGRGGMVRAWDLSVGPSIVNPLIRELGAVDEVAVAVLHDGTPIAVTSGGDGRGGMVRAWDLAAGSPIGRPVTVPAGFVEGSLAVAATVLLSGTLIAVTCSPDGTVQVWDLDVGTSMGEPLIMFSFDPEHSPLDGVAGVATAVLPDGTPIAVTGSTSDRLRLWNLASLTPIGGLATGLPIRDPWFGAADNKVPVAAAVRRDGTPIAVVRSNDGSKLRAWDLAAGTPIGAELTGPEASGVGAAVLPDGTPIAVTGGYDGTIRAWDLAAGTPICTSLTGHKSAVAAVAAAVLPGGTLIAVTGGYDATVRAWDVLAGREAGHPLHVIGPVDAVGVHTTGGVVTAILVGGGIGCIDLAATQLWIRS